jgi:hypothetical protein
MAFTTLALLIVFTSPLLQARVINVPEDFETIQAGIDSSADGDTVLVQPGRYIENINFEGKGITVASLILATGDTTYLDSTVIRSSDRSGRSVVVFLNDEGEESKLIGFTLTNGTSDYGGGIYINGSSPTLEYLTITENLCSRNGGGIYCTNGAAPVIANVSITDNIANEGGGLACYNDADVRISNSIITHNRANDDAGGIQCSGSRLVMNNVYLSSNRAGDAGGGLTLIGDARLIIIEGMMGESTSPNPMIYCSGYGGTVYLEMDEVLVNLNGDTISDFMYANQCSTIINNCTIYSHRQRSGINTGQASFIVTSSIIRGFRTSFSGLSRNDIIQYCNVNGEIEGEGNIDADPLFADPENANFHLTADSPCIDAGDPESPLDPDGTRADMGAFYFHQRDIEVEPLELHFPPISWGELDSLPVNIANEGGTDLTIESIEGCMCASCIWMNEENPEEWQPITLEPQQRIQLWVYYHPQEGAVLSRTFWVNSTDPDEPEITIEATGEVNGINTHEDALPLVFSLNSPYPNPFNSVTQINYSLQQPEYIELAVYDLTGRQVDVIDQGYKPGGHHTTSYNAHTLPSGVYILTLTTAERSSVRKMLLIK